MLGKFIYQIDQFSCTSFCGSVLQLRNVNVKTMIWKYGWIDKSDLCSCTIKYSNPYFNYDGSKLFKPFAIGITVNYNSQDFRERFGCEKSHLAQYIDNVFLVSRHKWRDYRNQNALRRHAHDTSSTQGTASSEVFYLITLERGWVMLWLTFWGLFLKIVILRRRYRHRPYVASKC